MTQQFATVPIIKAGKYLFKGFFVARLYNLRELGGTRFNQINESTRFLKLNKNFFEFNKKKKKIK